MTVASTPQAREYSPFDITSHDFWSQPFDVRDQTFAQLRALDGVSWHRPLPTLFDIEEPGFLSKANADIEVAANRERITDRCCGPRVSLPVFAVARSIETTAQGLLAVTERYRKPLAMEFQGSVEQAHLADFSLHWSRR